MDLVIERISKYSFVLPTQELLVSTIGKLRGCVIKYNQFDETDLALLKLRSMPLHLGLK